MRGQLSLKAANNLPMLVEGITCVKIQIDDQWMVDQIGVVVTHGPVDSSVPIVLGMNMLKDLDLPHLLAKFKYSGQWAQGCGLRAAWLNIIQACKVQ